LIDRNRELMIRDRALRLVRGLTLGAVFGAGTLTGGFSIAAAAYFSGQPVARTVTPPVIPIMPAPVQKAPASLVAAAAASGSAPLPAQQAPGAPAAAPAPAPPPPPACTSTPSKPC